MGSAEIVTVGAEGTPIATLLPILWSGDGATVIAHMARANAHWRTIDVDSPCLVSQNRSEVDQTGVIAGLRGENDPRRLEVADAMDQTQRF